MINTWRTWQFAQSLSARTVTERTQAVTRMAEWNRVQPEAATVEHVVRWLAEGGTWAPSTRWTYHAALSAWFLWLQKQGFRADNPMVMVGKPRKPKGEPRPVSNEDLVRLLRVRVRRRTKAMILLASFEGLRAHEIAKVKAEHLDLIGRTITVTGKGGVTATLPLHHRVIEQAYQMPRRGYWFPGVDGGHQRRESICTTVKEAMIRAGIPGSAHSLRHWFGTALVEAGVDLRTVQTLMRHQNLTSTAIYTLVSERRRAAGIELLDPFQITAPRVLVTPTIRPAIGYDDDETAA